MQVLMNKKEKEQLVITLHKEGRTIRQIAQQVHMSFKDIGTIIRKIHGGIDNNGDRTSPSTCPTCLSSIV
jgi:transcriptional antiterminator